MSATTLDDVRTATEVFFDLIGSVSDEVVQEPSRLPGWSVGHVLAHIALNAEAFVRVAEAVRSGEFGEMYPGGPDRRAADIEEAASRSGTAIRQHVRQACEAFETAWSTSVPDGLCATAVGFPPFASSEVLSRRLREVSVHTVDTGLPGASFERWVDRFVDDDLPDQWTTIGRRTDASVRFVDEEGVEWVHGDRSAGGGLAITTTRRALLAWLLDRHVIAQAPELIVWGDQSRWRAA